MAILFGTTPDGETLPVQVNEFGQLVAKGLPGEQGEQGEQGPIGPPGSFQFTQGSFDPEFVALGGTGAAVINYSGQSGYWWRFGPVVTVSVWLWAEDVVITDARGSIGVGGIPQDAWLARPTDIEGFGQYSIPVLSFRGHPAPLVDPNVRWRLDDRAFMIFEGRDSLEPIPWTALEGSSAPYSRAMFTYTGLAYDAVESVPLALDWLL